MKKKNLTRLICYCGLFAALSIVFGKYLAINLTPFLRVSLESLPIFCAAYFFGAIPGAAVAVAADLVGCLLVGYTINPVITLGAFLIGLCAGLWFFAFRRRKKSYPFFLCGILISHLIGSMIVKSLGLYLYMGVEISVLLLRVPIYLVIGAGEALILYELSKTSVFSLWRKADEV